MPFRKINRFNRGNSRDADSIRMGSHLAAGSTSRGVYIAVGANVVQQVGWPVKGITENRHTTSVEILEGTGQDGGFWMLAHDEDNGYTLGSEKKTAYSFNTTVTAGKLKHYVLNEVPSAVEQVEFTVDEKEQTILIQCPDWLRYNPESYKEPEVVQPTRHPLHVVPVERDEGRPHRRRVR